MPLPIMDRSGRFQTPLEVIRPVEYFFDPVSLTPEEASKPITVTTRTFHHLMDMVDLIGEQDKQLQRFERLTGVSRGDV